MEVSDLKDTLESGRFYPLIPHIEASALRSEEADVLMQHHQTDSLLFTYLQSVARKSFDVCLNVPSDSLFFVFNELGVSVWDIKCRGSKEGKTQGPGGSIARAGAIY